MKRLRDFYLTAWAIGASAAAATHLLFAESEGDRAQWIASPGWQREIGIFNIAVALLNVQFLISGSEDGKRAMVRTAVPLALLLGANHVAALVNASSGPTQLHRGAILLNAASFTMAVTVLAGDRRRTRNAQAVATG
jgi:hypothetical protein